MIKPKSIFARLLLKGQISFPKPAPKKNNPLVTPKVKEVDTGVARATREHFSIDVSRCFNKVFTGIKVTKQMSKVDALRHLYYLAEEAGMTAECFGTEVKPNFATMTDSKADAILRSLKELLPLIK